MMPVRVLILLAVRSLVAHRVKSAIVGALLMGGTLLVVIGGALLDSVEETMAQSITSSLSGHLQVYAADSEDALSVFGGVTLTDAKLGEIDDFATVEARLETVENVKAIVPMGITNATVLGRNDIDKVLDELRDAVRAEEPLGPLIEKTRRVVAVIASTFDTRAEVASDPAKVQADREALDRAGSDTFWGAFDADPLAGLDFLDARIAPLATDARLLYLRVLGTDPQQFAEAFDRFYIVDGMAIAPGERGMLISKRTHEKLLKNPVARELDEILNLVRDGAIIAEDPLLQQRIARNVRQYQRVVFQLSPRDADALDAELRTLLPEIRGDLADRVQAFLRVDDANLEARHAFFYATIAPRIRLYEYGPGDDITLRAFTKSGYIRSVNVHVAGTYEFRGLETSDLATATNLIDLMTWRELYGKMTASQQAELAEIRASAGVQDVRREDAEAALFGGGGDVVADAAPSGSLTDVAVDRTDALARTYLPEELRQGLVLNAAILLDDADRIDATRRAIEDLAPGLGVNVVDWQEASGLLGQFVVVMRAVLYLAIFVIFLVALVIVNNTMVMATLERTPEIGTMRAIGAPRQFVTALFLVETLVLGLISGAVGAAIGVLVVLWLGQVGIPGGETLVILFAGPRLYPTVGADDVAFGMAVITLVSLLSTLYPARVAARVPPIVAMQGKE